MRRKDLTVPNINPSNADYPFGKIRNDEGSGDGTPVVEELYGDIHETITAIVKDSQIVIPNGLPDNASNGYQIFQAMFQTPTKHNIVYDFETNEDNKFVVNEHISNLKLKEYMVLNFVGTDDKQNVISVDKIIDKSGSEFQCFPVVDFNGNFTSNTRYFIERYNSDSFRIYPIVSLSLLSDLYERFETLENEPTERVVELPNKTVTGSLDSFSFNSSSFVMDRLLSWEITWERYVSESGGTATFIESNKQLNLTSGQSIDMVRFDNTPSGGFIRFTGMNGYVLNKVKLILKYKPDAIVSP